VLGAPLSVMIGGGQAVHSNRTNGLVWRKLSVLPDTLVHLVDQSVRDWSGATCATM
jgi:hypothetical protein